MRQLPQEFLGQVRVALEDETEAFIQSLEFSPPVSVLMNPRKPIVPFDDSTNVSWCPHGRYLPQRPSFVMDPLYHGGAYYPMEASSMLLWKVMREIYGDSAPSTLLDLCAAPGGKSFVLSTFLNGRAFHLANEVNRSRYAVLKENVARWGDPSLSVSNLDPSRISLPSFFDCVVVDAPCSGEGLFRKTPDAVDEWSPDHVKHCSLRQRRILSEAARLTSPSGILIYSTCTYNSAENIQNVKWLATEFGFESIEMQLGNEPVHVSEGGCHGYQCWPHRARGEGFFVAALRKTNGTARTPKVKGKAAHFRKASRREAEIWRPYLSDYARVYSSKNGIFYAMPEQAASNFEIASALTPITPATQIGQLKRETVVPSHELALSECLSGSIPKLELTKEQALTYLRKEVPQLMVEQQGWIVVTYHDICLGWIKASGKKIKNYLPIGLRIRKR